MPAYGGFSPGFERYGGGRPNVVEAIFRSICQQRGTAYDTSNWSSNVYLENMALARAIAECWSNNVRLANQWDTARMTEFIPRWERILGLAPLFTDTDIDRRTRIAAAFARIAQAGIYQTVYDQMLATLGSNIFRGIVTTASGSAAAVVWTPAGWTMGSHDATKVLNWYSTVAHILISVTQPAGMKDGEFYVKCGAINPILDTLLPAWMTWDWARNTTTTPLHVVSIATITGAGGTAVVATNTYNGAAQHGFVVGQTVTIAGHSNVSYNGSFVISAVGGATAGGTGSTFTVPLNAGSGTGGTASAPGFFCDGDKTLSGSLVNLDNEAFFP